MLNYLTLLPLHGTVFLEVDPRHILGIKHDHGIYFGEVIAQCGLKTSNIVIVLSVHSQYARYYQQLLAGLDNYRHQGYQIALKFDYLVRNKTALDLITKLSPNYVSVSAKGIDHGNDNTALDYLGELTTVVASINGQSILQKIEQKKTDSLARKANFDLVEGSYYRAIAFDYRGKLGAN
jgi:EAL domain-containing protein (putative c-di-GMP-specific phosphodiesterase class I)